MCDDNPLHRARVARGIDLNGVIRETRLSPRIVESIDEGRFEQLPQGVYARSYVRAFAAAVGLDPNAAVQELYAALPAIDDPLPALRDIARGAGPDWPEALSDFCNGAAAACVAAVQQQWTAWEQWRLPAARWVAASLDAAALLALLASLVQLTAWTSGVPVNEVLAVGDAGVATLWGVLVLLYFLLLGGVGGRTPGAVACGLPPSAATSPLGLRRIVERAMGN